MCRKGAAMKKALLSASCKHKHTKPAKNFIIAVLETACALLYCNYELL
jgi:hypothetical protein